MLKKTTLLCSLLMSLAVGCAADSSEPPTKDEARSAAVDGKADHVDWCAELGWYNDGVCDEFCSEPDPDCALSCEESDCGPQPSFQPRICENGSAIFPSVSCEAEADSCQWDFSVQPCPEDRICEQVDCGPQPEVQPQPCQDGSQVFPSIECAADAEGACGWDIRSQCPQVCSDEDCGILPEFQPRVCEDGTFIFPSSTCELSESSQCGWSHSAPPCPED